MYSYPSHDLYSVPIVYTHTTIRLGHNIISYIPPTCVHKCTVVTIRDDKYGPSLLFYAIGCNDTWKVYYRFYRIVTGTFTRDDDCYFLFS